MSALLLAAITTSAAAALQKPVLTKTNPVSPGASLTPRINGEIDSGGGTTIVKLGVGLAAGGPVARVELDNTIAIYTDELCEGALAGEGTVAELLGGGISLLEPVDPNSVTVFYARQIKESEAPSKCSAGLRYRQVNSAPAAPVFDAVAPASPADDNFPRLLGIADPEATISIFAGASCTGGPLVSGSGAEFASPGLQVTVADNSETIFSARASIAGFVSSCSAESITYREVTFPSDPGGGDPGGDPGGEAGPGGGNGGSGGQGGGVSPGIPAPAGPPPAAPRLRTNPGGSANNNNLLVAGSAPGASAVRIYASEKCDGPVVAKGSATELEAGIAIRVADNETIVLSAVAVGGEKASRCSDPVVYVEDSLAPRTRITMGPAAKTAKRKAIFRFADTMGNAPGTTFLCKVDKRKWSQCSSPLRLRKLKPRKYVIRIKATDPAGNVETKGAKRSFKVVG